ncbi:MAG: hypothetical protein HZC29_04230 [Thaumarchaeota archaeon]|nr:hypothetical protein [Nitrososphaerota archaeon]
MYQRDPPKGINTLVELGLIEKFDDDCSHEGFIEYWFTTKHSNFSTESLDNLKSMFNATKIEICVDVGEKDEPITNEVHIFYEKPTEEK